MSTFAESIINQEARGANGMKALKSSASKCVDLFFSIGASRGKNIVPAFTAAYVEDRELALRIVQWARDVRGGAGEREIFRSVLQHLELTAPEDAMRLMLKVPEIGRYDDLLVFKAPYLKNTAYSMLHTAIKAGNGLAAKWLPREKSSKSAIAKELMKSFGMDSKTYRKTLASLTNVVETQMSGNDWDNINFSHVPSVAHARYRKAFGRHGDTYAEYVSKLVKGDASVKINANAIFPHDVLKGRITAGTWNRQAWSKTELDVIEAQWAALPNFIGDASVLPLVDVSGSMECAAGKKGSTTCLEVAVSLGLYFADKNKGKFKDCFLNFSSDPDLLKLTGNINQKIDQMVTSSWGMSTDLHKAFDKILSTAVNANVPADEMPKTLVIFSDMNFDCCGRWDDSAFQMISRKYESAGYTIPQIVFWNLNDNGTTPVKATTNGVALVSGFSPAIAASVLGANPEDFTPEAMMRKSVMVDRYNID